MSVAASHQTAQAQFIDIGSARLAYRRFGGPSPTPLVLLQHFRGNLDNWDPALTDALALEREVILAEYPGVGSSGGEPGRTIAGTARQMIDFVAVLELEQVDLLGFSIGGFIAQEIALVRPQLIRRLILAATGPKGAPGMQRWRPDIEERSGVGEFTPENLLYIFFVLYIFFAHTETSQAKGREFLARFMQRTEDRDPRPTVAVRDAQYEAIVDWGIPDHSALQRLTAIVASTLIIQGDNDLMIPTKVSHLLAGLIPDARIRIYPDSGHAFLFQYPAEVAAEISAFLGDE
jgi:pimeloyl-ACP methyl ester carboxylesterase